MKNFATIILLSFLVINCNSNNTDKNEIQDRKDAEKVVQKFYIFLRENNRDEIFKLCGNEFFMVVSKENVNQMLDAASLQFGNIKNESLIYWQANTIKSNNSKNEYVLIYNINRDIKNTQEKFTLHKNGDSIKIVGYFISPINQ